MANETKIAIIGMSCRVAGAESTAKLWDVLASSKDVQKENPRFSGFYNPRKEYRKGLASVNRGYYIEQEVDRFDNAFFSIPPVEASSMDPQQRMLLEVTYEAVENAGIPLESFTGTNTAVYTGMTWSDYSISLSRDLDMTPKYMSTGGCNAIAANRVSYFFDLRGPSMVLDTACSSTMVGLHQAVQALQSGEAEMAVVNGSNLLLNPDVFVHMSELGFLSPTGRCRSFDAGGDGYVRAEGVIAILLKPLDKALADGDPVRAVIRGTQLNQDGRTQGITLPNSDAQRENMRRLYERVGVDPATIQYFEAHGTGTAAGDPLEVSAINAIYKESHSDNRLVVGSVKSNIGHLEAVAALAGLVKTVESLERGLIPPQMHFVNPNPKIDFSSIEIPTSVTPWPRTADGVRRAAINSFGFGGTNGHTVLEHIPKVAQEEVGYDRPYLFKVSAATDDGVKRMAANYAQYIESKNPSVRDLAHTLLSRRSTLKKSIFISASNTEELVEALKCDDLKTLGQYNDTINNVAFVFTGQGAQWPTMGRQLVETSPLFRSVVSECSSVLKELPDAPTWDALDELCKPKTTSRVYESAFSQPLCTILQIALVDLWRSWGLQPAAVVGHSSGEVAAAYCAGFISKRDAVVVAYYRGKYLGDDLAKTGMKKGSMCAVGVGQAKATKLISPYVGRIALACVNSPSSCTLSGDEDAIVEIVEQMKEEGVFCRQLRVSSAYHSHHMLPMAPSYQAAMTAAGVRPVDGLETQGCRMFSSVTGKELQARECIPSYWKQNMTSTVRFSDAVGAMTRALKVDAVVEVGPHPALKGPAEDTFADLNVKGLPYFWSCSRGEADLSCVLQNVGRMITHGLRLRCDRINAIESVDSCGVVSYQTGRVLTDLPQYSWDHSNSFWGETRQSYDYRHKEFPRHELLGSSAPSGNPLVRSWRNLMLLSELPWLKNILETEGHSVLPPSVYLLMAIEAMKQAGDTSRKSIDFKNFAFHNDLPLAAFDSDPNYVEFHTHLTRLPEEDAFEISIYAEAPAVDFKWTKLASGKLTTESSLADQIKIPNVSSHGELTPAEALSGVDQLHLTARHASGTISRDPENDLEYDIAPEALGTVLHLPISMLLKSAVPRLFKLTSIDSFSISIDSAPSTPYDFNVVCSKPINGRASADALIANSDLGPSLCIRGAQYVAQPQPQALECEPRLESLFFQMKSLPDISHAEKLETTDLQRVVELISHKWPMADIGIVGLDAEQAAAISRCFYEAGSWERPGFRSITIVGDYSGSETSRIRVVDSFAKEQQFHAFFSPASVLKDHMGHVLRDGLVFVIPDESTDPEDTELISPVCSNVVAPWGVCTLGRPPRPIADTQKTPVKISVLVPSGVESPRFDFDVSEQIVMDDKSIQEFSQRKSSEQFDVVVLDFLEKSILADLPGSVLMPWVQCLLPYMRNLLWVSRRDSNQPCQGLSSAFIRTLCTEHPTLKAKSLVFEDEHDMSRLAELTSKVYAAMLDGDNEVEILARDGTIHALRYVPDDELSASVGLRPPVTASGSHHSIHHQVTCETPGEVSLLQTTSRASTAPGPSPGKIRIAIEASLIDHEDFLSVKSVQPYSSSSLGLFFIGTVTADKSGSFSSGTRVFGWCQGAHSSHVEVSVDQVVLSLPTADIVDSLTRLAHYTTAVCILDHGCRIRPGDTIKVAGISKSLCRSLSIVAARYHAFITNAVDAKSDVEITHGPKGLLINDHVFELGPTLQRYGLPLLVGDRIPASEPDNCFTIDQYKSAFSAVDNNGMPSSRILLHNAGEAAKDSLMTYSKPSKIFRYDGAYVLLGGLGGVGCELTKWMVTHGARRIVTVSRRGEESQGARELMEEVKRLGGQLDVLRADAANLEELERALDQVRKTSKIRGCFNLAIFLDDAPVSTMTAEQWDRPLQAKIKTSWNLHLATLKDELDFFVLFSSCVTMIGSRMQASYSTGNTFLNNLAVYRRSLGLVAISLLVPALTGFGVLTDQDGLLKYMENAGYYVADREDLYKFTEAAIYESQTSDRAIIAMGLQMFESIDGRLKTKPSQTQVFWADFPEFGFLMDHKLSHASEAVDVSLSERLASLDDTAAAELLLSEFKDCLASILGYGIDSFDPKSSIATYGLDSLNAVACRYWFFKELGLDVPVFDILGCKSIEDLITRTISKFRQEKSQVSEHLVPDPVHYEEAEIRPLSQSQKRLWFLHNLLPDQTVFNLLLVCHIEGNPKIELLEKAWKILINRHEVLRSRIAETPEGLQQLVVQDAPFRFEVIECSQGDHEAKLKDLTTQAKSHVYNIKNGELARCWLLTSGASTALFLGSHHMAWDRASTTVVFDEIVSIYKCLLANEDPLTELEPVPYQFLDYTIWQQQCLTTPEFINPLAEYWTSQLQGSPESVSLLPFAKVDRRPAMKQNNTDTVSFQLSADLERNIKTFCAEHALTPFMFMTSAIGALVHRLTRDNDVLIGISDSDRGHPAFDKLVGFTVNMLAIRSKPSSDQLYLDFLEEFRQTCLGAYEHRSMPFDHLLQILNVPRRTSHSPVFQITVNYQVHGAFQELDFGDFKFSKYDHYNARSQSDFSVDIEETHDGILNCVFEFDTAVYDSNGILIFAKLYETLIREVLATNGKTSLGAIQLNTAHEQSLISSILQPVVESSLVEQCYDSLFDRLFQDSVSRNPAGIALIDQDKCLSFSDLDRASNLVASHLIENGASAGETIALLCEPGADLITTIYGILKAGCAYLPINDVPEERLRSMIEDTNVRRAVVETGSKASRMVMCGLKAANVLHLDQLKPIDHETNTVHLPVGRAIQPQDPLCCIFTSGSTGRPKGLYLTHGSVRLWQEGYHGRLGTSAEDRILLASAPNFDMSLVSIYGAIAYGATLVLAPREAIYSPARMVDLVVDERVSSMTITPTQLLAMINSPNGNKLKKWKSLRTLVLGGEAVTQRTMTAFFGLGLANAKLWNGYGPSEATICVSLYQITPSDALSPSAPLSGPSFPASFYVLDDQGNQVPFGVPGELWISGPGLCGGYINRPDLTAEKFVEKLLASGPSSQMALTRAYATGDCFSLDHAGNFHFLGRVGGDRQVKIRGQRTELDEIEGAIWQALESADGLLEVQVQSLAVVYRKSEEILVAYLALAEADGDSGESLEELKRYLRFSLQPILPSHMRPNAYVPVSTLPITISGKTDYRTLASWPPPVLEDASTPSSEQETVALTPIQRGIAAAWREVTGTQERIGPKDDFFSVGGHSLALMQVQSAIQDKFGVTLAVADMFAEPSLEGMERLVIIKQTGPTNGHNGTNGTAHTNGNATNGIHNGDTTTFIDWKSETALPEDIPTDLTRNVEVPETAIIVTGASTLIGSYFLHRMLTTTNLTIYCLAEKGQDKNQAKQSVIVGLKHCKLDADLPPAMLDHIVAFPGALTLPTLGLSSEDISFLDREAQAIYNLASDVSLFGNYDKVRDGNLGVVRFLISLASGLSGGNIKPLHHLSTWATLHLQSWKDTTSLLANPTKSDYILDERELNTIEPGTDGTLAYLKARWACEAVLHAAARRGLPVSIFRSSMCAMPSSSGLPLPRWDINRRILLGSLQTGLVPDFGSARRGGMSWVTFDFLADSIAFLTRSPSHAPAAHGRADARIWHIVSKDHYTYRELADVLGPDLDGRPLRATAPEAWFAALKAEGNAEMTMQAEVLEKWYQNGWVPFEIDGKATLDILEKEAGLKPPRVTRRLLLENVVGDDGF
ncbi:hypothetical protein F5Y06DRAFT_297186 [Hypoxylon sp. FL0890]|nr:hypothetical protein F5Y06DRAFT_297186 [Hypoxylon sp. FL0890]